MAYVLVDPSERLNWSHDWDDAADPWLAEGDSIASRLWTISPQSGSPETPTLTNATSDVVIVEDFEVGKVYRLNEHVVTANGLEGDRAIVIRCDDR